MSHERAHELQDLIESHAGHQHDEEVSGVRPRAALTTEMVMEVCGDEPVNLYASVLVEQPDGQEVRRRYYLGTQFDLGIIPSSCWRDELQGERVSAAVIDSIANWVSERAL